MGLRCTVIGHDYGNVQQVEERQERGDELVVTVREYRECRRCDDRKTLTENTEVRSGDVDDGGDDTPDTGQTADDSETVEPVDTGVDRSPGSTPTTGETSTEGNTGFGSVDPFTDAGAPGENEDGVNTTDDDGIILDDNGVAEDGRGHGEWPGEADTERTRTAKTSPTPSQSAGDHPEQTRSTGDDTDQTRPAGDDARTDDTDHGDWPTPDAEDRGHDATPSADADEDAGFPGDLGTAESGDSATGSTPDERVGEGTANAPGSATGTARSKPAPSAQATPGVGGAVLACPSCESTSPSQAGPHRPGDICPECRQGYLTEREE